MATIEQISPREAAVRLASDAPPRLVDVRTHGEYDLAHVANSVFIPMQEIVDRVDELDPEESLIILCHHGVRSYRVAAWLLSIGFEKVANLSGGIDRWSQEVDPEVPRY